MTQARLVIWHRCRAVEQDRGPTTRPLCLPRGRRQARALCAPVKEPLARPFGRMAPLFAWRSLQAINDTAAERGSLQPSCHRAAPMAEAGRFRRRRVKRGCSSSVVEHSLGKGEVERSIRSMGTKAVAARKYTPTFARSGARLESRTKADDSSDGINEQKDQRKSRR